MRVYKVVACLGITFSSFFAVLLLFCRDSEDIALELHNKFVTSIEEVAKTKKVILMYNHMGHEHRYPILDGYCLDTVELERQRMSCPYQCFYTDDKSVLDLAHAVVFSGRDLKATNVSPIGLPQHHKRGQYWVLLNLEPPIYPYEDRREGKVNILESNLTYPAFAGVFNWTMSYRQDADIRVPFGRVLNKIPAHQDIYLHHHPHFSSKEIRRKKKLVAWISTNCYMERSGSSFLVAQLRKFLPVDIYGECGSHRCEGLKGGHCSDIKLCYEEISSKYKFYLALEDALCEDYVTEKFFYALEYGMVPIVYGKADYSDIAVPGSFINVLDFESVEQLAEHLRYLHSHPEEYLKYFSWRRDHVVTTSFHLNMGWCSLCAELWDVGFNQEPRVPSSESTTPHPRISVDEQVAVKSEKTVGLPELTLWWSKTAFSSRVCDRPPDFIMDTDTTFELPRAPKRVLKATGSASHQKVDL